MRIRVLIVASLLAGCGSVGFQPTASTIARIETGMAVLEDMQVVGAADSAAINRAARTQVRNVQCLVSAPGRVLCTFEARRAATAGDWEVRRRTFVRGERTAAGSDRIEGWAPAEDAPCQSNRCAELPATLMELGLWDPPATRAQPVTPPLGQPESETLFAHLAPSQWSEAMSAAGVESVSAKDIRRVTCVGLETTYMLCAWEQRIGGEWRPLSKYADISQIDGRPILTISDGDADREDQDRP